MPDQPINSINDTCDRMVAGCLQTPVAIVATCLINSFYYNMRQHPWSINNYYDGVYYTVCTQYTFTHILMMKLPRVLDLRNRRSCNIVVPNRRPLFPIFLVPGALNGANTVIILGIVRVSQYLAIIQYPQHVFVEKKENYCLIWSSEFYICTYFLSSGLHVQVWLRPWSIQGNSWRCGWQTHDKWKASFCPYGVSYP